MWSWKRIQLVIRITPHAINVTLSTVAQQRPSAVEEEVLEAVKVKLVAFLSTAQAGMVSVWIVPLQWLFDVLLMLMGNSCQLFLSGFLLWCLRSLQTSYHLSKVRKKWEEPLENSQSLFRYSVDLRMLRPQIMIPARPFWSMLMLRLRRRRPHTRFLPWNTFRFSVKEACLDILFASQAHGKNVFYTEKRFREKMMEVLVSASPTVS